MDALVPTPRTAEEGILVFEAVTLSRNIIDKVSFRKRRAHGAPYRRPVNSRLRVDIPSSLRLCHKTSAFAVLTAILRFLGNN